MSAALSAIAVLPTVVSSPGIAQGAEPPDSLLAIDRDLSRYERDATKVRQFLVDATRRGVRSLGDEPLWPEREADWHKLNGRADEIEERTCGLRATTAAGIKVKQRVAAWLRIRAPGLERAEFAQRVVASIHDDALAMAMD